MWRKAVTKLEVRGEKSETLNCGQLYVSQIGVAYNMKESLLSPKPGNPQRLSAIPPGRKILSAGDFSDGYSRNIGFKQKCYNKLIEMDIVTDQQLHCIASKPSTLPLKHHTINGCKKS